MIQIASPILRAKVLEGGRVIVQSPDLKEGDDVEVILLSNGATAKPTGQSGEPQLTRENLMEFLDGLPGQRLFKTPEDVKKYMDEERDSWER